MLVAGQIDLPGQPPTPVKPASATDPGYIEFLERNTHIIYPALGVLVVVLLAVGILQAWRTQDLDGLAKAEYKREIILEIRRQVGGVTAEALSRAIGLETFKLLRLLEEMQRDGLLVSHTNTQRLTVWRVKGIGDGTHGVSSQKRRRSSAR
ncbi:MAG: hypothetical protein IRZ16_23660 [Myxococcaceae bacterium]|nr:hypothetical protein [Myxococcaceae bacterium]